MQSLLKLGELSCSLGVDSEGVKEVKKKIDRKY